MDIHGLRREYANHGLDHGELDADPIAQFRVWFKQACDAGILEPNALVLATVSPEGAPTSRVLLLKAFDQRGFTFFTNFNGRKATDLATNPRASMTFPWIDLERQVHLQGKVERVSEAETLAYFLSRPYGSQLGAWASDQSQPIADRQALERRMQELRDLHPEGKVPLPPHWGGLRLIPETVEFWQGRPSRLHDRFLYTRKGQSWVIQRLQP
jgi:pyridoxamine 5'-phosphate oxidase